MRFSCALLLTTLLACSTLLVAEPADYSRMAGSYSGEVYNGNDMDPVVTSFTLTANGRLRGNYIVEDEIEIVEGTISNAVLVEGRTWSFEWTDKYGEGSAVLIFSDDFQSFRGYWTDKSAAREFPWSGVKQ